MLGTAASLGMAERLRTFGLTDDLFRTCKLMWSLIETDARQVAETQIDGWNAAFPMEYCVQGEQREIAIGQMINDLRDRFDNPAGNEWVRRASRRVTIAFEAGVSLTTLIAIGGERDTQFRGHDDLKGGNGGEQEAGDPLRTGQPIRRPRRRDSDCRQHG